MTYGKTSKSVTIIAWLLTRGMLVDDFTSEVLFAKTRSRMLSSLNCYLLMSLVYAKSMDRSKRACWTSLSLSLWGTWSDWEIILVCLQAVEVTCKDDMLCFGCLCRSFPSDSWRFWIFQYLYVACRKRQCRDAGFPVALTCTRHLHSHFTVSVCCQLLFLLRHPQRHHDHHQQIPCHYFTNGGWEEIPRWTWWHPHLGLCQASYQLTMILSADKVWSRL